MNAEDSWFFFRYQVYYFSVLVLNSLAVPLYDTCTWNAKVLDMWGKMDWSLIWNLLLFYFLCIFTHTPPTVNCGETELLFCFPFSLRKYPKVGIACEMSFSFPKFFESLSDCLRILCLVSLMSVSHVSSILQSDWLYCSETVGDSDLFELEAFFTALEKIN